MWKARNYCYRPHTKCGGRLCFYTCLSFCSQEGVKCLVWRGVGAWSWGCMVSPPQTRYLPHLDQPSTPPPSPPRPQTCQDMSTGVRYASYWNAFLFQFIVLFPCNIFRQLLYDSRHVSLESWDWNKNPINLRLMNRGRVSTWYTGFMQNTKHAQVPTPSWFVDDLSGESNPAQVFTSNSSVDGT